MNSASAYCCAERVGVEAVVIPELKFCNIQTHVFGGNLMKCTEHPAFETAN